MNLLGYGGLLYQLGAAEHDALAWLLRTGLWAPLLAALVAPGHQSGPVRILSGHRSLIISRPYPNAALTCADNRPDTSGQGGGPA